MASLIPSFFTICPVDEKVQPYFKEIPSFFLPIQALNKGERDGTMFSSMSISMLTPFGYQQVDRQILCETIDLRQCKTSIRTFNVVFEMAIALVC